jgi:hypothetical protein
MTGVGFFVSRLVSVGLAAGTVFLTYVCGLLLFEARRSSRLSFWR